MPDDDPAAAAPGAPGAIEYQTLFNATPGLYLVLDPQLRIVAVNDAYTRATRTRREDIVGRALFDVFPDNPDDPATEGMRNLRVSLQRVLRTARPDAMPVQKYDIRKPDHEGGGFEVRYWSPLNTPVLGHDGRPSCIIHRVEDITEFVRMRERGEADSRLNDELRQRAARMEAEVFTRSREVAEASAQLKGAHLELEHLYERTRELDELKTRFFANVSHELRTPLTLILGPLGRLRDAPTLGEAERHQVQVALRNARLLHRQVDDLLDLAKLDAGHMLVHYARYDLAQQLRVLASHFETVADDRHIRYEIDLPGPVVVEADPEKCERIVLNLLSNAFKFAPEGGTIAVSLSTSQGQATLSIADSGPGVPEALWATVFERFRQVDDSAQRRSGGTGLGLAIVKEFVTLLQGQVTLDRAPLGGARFSVTLPLQAPEGAAVATPAEQGLVPSPRVATMLQASPHEAAPPLAQTAPASAPQVLVVEDNPDMNRFIVTALMPQYRVVHADDGITGLRLALEHRPDLIVSDVMMPGLSGERLVQALRQHAELDDTPIVMLTAKADDTLRAQLLRHGVQDYIHKPFSTDELLARVAGLLRDRERVGRRLRRTEARFRATFEQAAVGMAHLTPDGQWLRVNHRLCEIFGYTEDELLRCRFRALRHPQDPPRDVEAGNRLLAGEDAHCTLEMRYVRKDGATVWGQLTLVLVRDEDGSPDYFIAVVEDVTARRLAEDRLRQAAAVFDSASEAVMITDLQGRLQAVNQAFCDMTGYSRGEALGQNASLLRSDRHGPDFFQALWASLRQTGRWQGEVWNRHKGGELFPGWMTISTVLDEQRQPTQYVALLTDMSQIRRREQQLDHLAHHDPLTGLPNRLLLQSRLEHALDHARRSRCRVAVLFINLDRFKNINDSLGHAMGDQLLVEVAKRLRRRVRSDDTLGRFAGDEFMLVLETVARPDDVAKAAQDLLNDLVAPFELPGGLGLYVSGSLGIGVYPEDGNTAEALLRSADVALHQAKRQGRNRFCFYAASMDTHARANLDLERALHQALERREFLLHYQPKVDARSGRICGAEALIRWRREDGQLESPARFIPLAEASGLIVPIGNWVIDEVARQCKAWRQAGLDIGRVALNVSARQFRANDLMEVVGRALSHHGLSPDALELELTESMLMDDPQQTIGMLKALKQLGVHLSLDDFGTGYSSFAYLSRFPIDALKIDQSFVRHITSEREAALIAVSIIDLAHNMGLKVVAEGIEASEQLLYLRARGCDEMQGYLFSRPLDASAFDRLVRQGHSFTG